jgi:hypothetical protein
LSVENELPPLTPEIADELDSETAMDTALDLGSTFAFRWSCIIFNASLIVKLPMCSCTHRDGDVASVAGKDPSAAAHGRKTERDVSTNQSGFVRTTVCKTLQ